MSACQCDRGTLNRRCSGCRGRARLGPVTGPRCGDVPIGGGAAVRRGRESSKPPRWVSYQKNPGGTKTRTGSANQFNRGTAPSYTGARPRRHTIVKVAALMCRAQPTQQRNLTRIRCPGVIGISRDPPSKIPPSRGTSAHRKSRLRCIAKSDFCCSPRTRSGE